MLDELVADELVVDVVFWNQWKDVPRVATNFLPDAYVMSGHS